MGRRYKAGKLLPLKKCEREGCNRMTVIPMRWCSSKCRDDSKGV